MTRDATLQPRGLRSMILCTDELSSFVAIGSSRKKIFREFCPEGLFFTPLPEDVGGRPRSCLAGAVSGGKFRELWPRLPVGAGAVNHRGETGEGGCKSCEWATNDCPRPS